MSNIFENAIPASHMLSLKWGTRGKDGRQPLKLVNLVDCDKDHLEAILKNCPHIRGTVFELAIRTLLEC